VHPPEKIRRILFASDFSEASQCGVPFAASLASDAKAELVALHVLPSTTAANPEVNQLVDPLREELRKMFAGYLPKGMEPEAMISFGDAAEVIVREAELLAADLIVLGVRHGFSSHGFTNIADRVAISSPCPVLSVRETIAARH
jgi:nucleotide-binding universal stress UspA family protein